MEVTHNSGGSMTGKIEPALTAEEWARFRDSRTDVAEMGTPTAYLYHYADPGQCLAVANAMLPDSDPRKITDEKVGLLRNALRTIRLDRPGFNLAELDELADALESYLPPG